MASRKIGGEKLDPVEGISWDSPEMGVEIIQKESSLAD